MPNERDGASFDTFFDNFITHTEKGQSAYCIYLFAGYLKMQVQIISILILIQSA